MTASKVRSGARNAAPPSIESTQASLRDAVRSAIGVDPVVDQRLRNRQLGVAASLGALAAASQLQGLIVVAFGPEIADGLGYGSAQISALIAVRAVLAAAFALPIAAISARLQPRASWCVLGGAGCAIVTAFSAVAPSWTLLFLALVVGAVFVAIGQVFHEPFLMETYPYGARVRAFATYYGARQGGAFVAVLLVALSIGSTGIGWRGALVAGGLAGVGLCVGAARLLDPERGRWETEPVRQVVHAHAGDVASEPPPEVRLGFFESVRRLFLARTVRPVLLAYAALGMGIGPLYTYVYFYLDDRWGVRAGGRAIFGLAVVGSTVLALAAMTHIAEPRFRGRPGALLEVASVGLAAAVAMFSFGAVIPVFAVMLPALLAGIALIAAVQPCLSVTVQTITPSAIRPHLAAMTGLFSSAVGAVGGALLLAGIQTRFGTSVAIVCLGVPTLAAAALLRGAASSVNSDLNKMLDGLVETEELAILAATGTHVPMLSCRHIDFSYGQLQVLFDVDFTVDEGEMVALLGTNGAGKSTLLRVISGLGLPSRGSVRLGGADVTFMAPERRLGLGIAQIPGGRAVFPPMTVLENLKAFGYSHGRSRRTVDNAIETSFEAFPRLFERRDQLAGSLSGGEQQMLGLSTAFMLRPRLLLIDELSLGLAPKIVGELLTMVRSINQAGTAVVLVEQSVNIALSLVDHAYFMEKGQVRFDGAASHLLDRPDLLRSVFLQGASSALSP